MKPPSFLVKVAVGNLLAVAAVMALVSTMAYRSLDEHFQAENRQSQEQSLKWLQKHLEDLWPLSADALGEQVKRLAKDNPMRITIVATDGLVLADSERDPSTMKLHTAQSRTEIRVALEGQLGEDSRVSDTLAVPFRYMALPIRNGPDGKTVAVVRTAIPIRSITGESAFIRNVFWWSALASVIATAILAMLLSWWWYLPLKHVTLTARRIASGNLSARARSSWTAELSQLAAALNEMRENLSQQITLVEAQRGDLQTVISNARESIIAIDSDGRIALANKSAIEMFTGDGSDPTGKALAAGTNVLEIADILNKAIASGQAVQKQVEIDRAGRKRVLDVHAIVLGQRTGGLKALLVAYEITDIMRSAAIRAEFAANASHELRTPLAILRGAVEAIEAVAPDDHEGRQKFVRMLDRQVKRLEDLTRDLLSLHAIESGKAGLRQDSISAADLAEWVKENYAERARSKGIALRVGVPADLTFTSDRRLVELILQNLLDNSIKFTPAAGSVDFLVGRTDDSVLLQVKDTGCGIPDELQSRVFERFFQADAGRSGDPSLRGTGLGLAIVKHAAERLGANVELISKVDKGTSITIIIPVQT